MVGWYHTGPQLRASDQEINDVFKRYIPQPVMVIVDTRQSTVGIPTEAYFAVEEIKDVRVQTSIYHLRADFYNRMGQSPNALSFTCPLR
jgi:proteasome lid subunit RPN8/RPN11